MEINGDQSRAKIASLDYHKKPITSVEWHPTDSSVLAASSEDGEITLWDLSVEKVIGHEEGPTNSDKDNIDVPPQLMFNHGGVTEVKEIHWHPGITSLVGCTGVSGLCFFKTINI